MDESEVQPEMPVPIKTYSLEEVAAMVLPDMKNGGRWLAERLNRGEIHGYKIGKWRMTEDDVKALIAAYSNTIIEKPPPEPMTVLDGLSPRSRRTLRRPVVNTPTTPAPRATSLPTGFQRVQVETPEAIAAMPPLTQAQLKLLERLQHEEQVVVHGQGRKTVEELVRRGLVTYKAEYALNEKHRYYHYRFTVTRVKNEPDQVGDSPPH